MKSQIILSFVVLGLVHLRAEVTPEQTLVTNEKIDVADLNQYLSDMTTSMAQTQKMLTKVQNDLTSLQENPVPVGFTYVQFATNIDPTLLWPSVRWIEITREYAGLFFRAEGGGSAQFGQVQEQQVPRISTVQSHHLAVGTQIHSMSIPATAGVSENRLFSGANSGGNYWGLQFHVTGTEVRPRNQAIRIWRRIY